MRALPYLLKDLPLHQQIYITIKEDIQDGVYHNLEKLPSKRKLAEELGVSTNTVSSAYSQLEAEGYIKPIEKRGCFVCPIDAVAHIPPLPAPQHTPSGGAASTIDFSPSDVDITAFPISTWRTLLRSCFDERDTDLLKSADSAGLPELRGAVAHYLGKSRGIACIPEQVVISGSTSSLLLGFSQMFKSSVVATENPVYNKAHTIFKGVVANTVALHTDKDGVTAEQLEGSGARVVYVTPSHQYPLGTSMPVPRRVQLLNWAGALRGRYIIEDDYDSELRYSGRPLPPLKSMDKNGQVIYIGTFSKCISPSVKVSYALLPSDLLPLYHENSWAFGGSVSRLEQNVLTQFIAQGYFERHLNRMRNICRHKHEVLVSTLRKYSRVEILGESAGHHLVISVQNGVDMVEKAKAAGVTVYPVSPYFIGEVPKKYRSSVLLGYGALTHNEIVTGVERLAKAWGIN